MKKYHHLIWELGRIVDIQLQNQNFVKLANTANIETALLQASNSYKEQIRGDIYSIIDNL